MSVAHTVRSRPAVVDEPQAPPTTTAPVDTTPVPAPGRVDVVPARRRRLRVLIDSLMAPDAIGAELDRSPTYRRAKADAAIGAMRRNITI